MILIGCTVLFSNCRKEKLLKYASAELDFSTDTVTFDTVFTQRGSATQQLKVFNPHDQRIRINSINLAGGDNGQFRMNVDGEPSPAVTDVEIAAKDSIYIFVEVTVDPTNQNNPFVIRDSIVYNVNGNQQKTILQARGQNANYYRPTIDGGENFPDFSIIDCNTTWTDEKPYVIQGFAVVDSGCTLTIEEGTQVHFANNASLFVFANGELKVKGTADNPVRFQGIRLEDFYDDVPGQWGGLWLSKGSKNNVINHAIIENAEVGIRVDSLPSNNAPVLQVRNSIIRNCLSTGILGLTSVIFAENCLIYNCGENNVRLQLGGLYRFFHCTMTNYGSQYIDHKKGILKMANARAPAPIYASFYNCIIHGSKDEEIVLDKNQNAPFNYNFYNSLLKTERNMADTNYVNVIKNSDPQFESISDDDYHLTSGSPAIDAGTSDLPDQLTSNPDTDLDEKQRDNNPDMGAYEF
ncbi:MAG: hypothetical protein BRD50_06930 [Bacteroidetes bacterium SW_11_45_7]|nr:MAG: hypothetical protein BRD50_06930 [Bacteroidetes bacterium SW_11_45_7]